VTLGLRPRLWAAGSCSRDRDDVVAPLLLALPWLGLLLFVRFVVRVPSELPAYATSSESPSLTVIIPARNEALNIERCVSSVTASEYPNFDVIVVDDRSDDGTADLARGLSAGNAQRVTVLDGVELPDGWLGKPWACHQGAAAATGDLLLFTDADTTHGSALMARAVAGLREEKADLLTLIGQQLMETFWERLVQPQVFLLMLLRFPDFERAVKNHRWRDAIANGQYLLFTRSCYETLGGHEAVKGEVVEDLVLAQLVKRAERQLRIRSAEIDFATRMYRSLPDLIAGWSKNLLIGGFQSMPKPVRPLVAPVALMSGIALWLAPPLTLVISLGAWAGGTSNAFLLWSATVCGLSVALWSFFARQMRVPAIYGLLYPLGAAIGTYIFFRSWAQGRNVRWKGRAYRVQPFSDLA